MKTAFVTGVTGQDGSYLAEMLLEKGYQVYGLIRRSADVNHANLSQVKDKLIFHQCDLTDNNRIHNLLDQIRPDEIYNLAAQSHVKVSFDMPTLTAEVNAIGPLRILDAVRALGLTQTRIYQASTSEMFGIVKEAPQNEQTPFYPGSPYGVAKLYAHWIMINYRESYNMFACNGILYNHESPRRGEMFVTRKITKAFANIMAGNQDVLELGNLNSLRDWGHARDYVHAMWLMLQQDTPDDYIIATGVQASVRTFCDYTANFFNISLEWEGEGINEIARDRQTGRELIRVNPKWYRPVDVINLLGDPSKARTKLGWIPKCNLEKLVNEMCENDVRLLK
jgi:GDPmannose 4,6-dehydratase